MSKDHILELMGKCTVVMTHNIRHNSGNVHTKHENADEITLDGNVFSMGFSYLIAIRLQCPEMSNGE